MLHGKWRIDELLGIGGVATVYAATDRSGQRVACTPGFDVHSHLRAVAPLCIGDRPHHALLVQSAQHLLRPPAGNVYSAL